MNSFEYTCDITDRISILTNIFRTNTDTQFTGQSLVRSESLKLISTDPSSVDDFDAMLNHLPHVLLATKLDVIENGKKNYIFLIQKG